MRIGIYSDLHIEFDENRSTPFLLNDDADIRVLAGDIHAGSEAITWLLEHADKPTLFVPGNHEFYGHCHSQLSNQFQRAFSGSNVYLLNRQSIEIEGVTFLGATLWTDFELFGKSEQAIAEWSAHKQMSDFRLIKLNEGRLTTSFWKKEFRESVSWLEAQLAVAEANKTVVVSHHLPSFRSVAERYRRSLLSAAFASNLDHLIEQYQPALWVHGHTHDSFDYQLGKTRVVCNPKGYESIGQLNPNFKMPYVLEV